MSFLRPAHGCPNFQFLFFVYGARANALTHFFFLLLRSF